MLSFLPFRTCRREMLGETLGTFLLVLLIFSLPEGCNLGRPQDGMAPLFIGLSVASVICLLAPLTQGDFNPARDFAPRIVAYLAGWGRAAFPDDRGGWFWVYIAGPALGGQAAAALFTRVVEPGMRRGTGACRCANSADGAKAESQETIE